jgi:hypothetical protein
MSHVYSYQTKGHCNLIQLAGKFKASARKQIAAKLLGREAAHDEFGVSNLREYFRSALEIDKKLTGDEADDRIALVAQEVVKNIDYQERKLADEAACNKTEEPTSEEPSGEQSAAGAAAETKPANESTEEMKTATKKKPAKKTTSNKPEAKATNGKADRGMSLLDAAAKILERRSNAMTVKELVAEAEERKLWKRGEGKTPEQTLAAAISTEISKKGKDSRFKKDSPGKFLLK